LHDIKEFLAHYVAQKAIEKRLNEAKEGIAKGNYLQEKQFWEKVDKYLEGPGRYYFGMYCTG